MTPGEQQGHAPGTGGTAGLVNAQSHAGAEGDAEHLCHPCQTPIPEPPGDIDPLAELRRAEASLPDGEVPLIRRARERSREAVDIVAAAVATDPTLPAADRCRRDIDLLAELLRHVRVLARQAERQRRAADELEALSARVVEIARRIAAAALPDWDTPARIRERSERLLPSRETLEEIADRLRRAVQPALLSHPAPEAMRLAALADQIAPRQA